MQANLQFILPILAGWGKLWSDLAWRLRNEFGIPILGNLIIIHNILCEKTRSEMPHKNPVHHPNHGLAVLGAPTSSF